MCCATQSLLSFGVDTCLSHRNVSARIANIQPALAQKKLTKSDGRPLTVLLSKSKDVAVTLP